MKRSTFTCPQCKRLFVIEHKDDQEVSFIPQHDGRTFGEKCPHSGEPVSEVRVTGLK